MKIIYLTLLGLGVHIGVFGQTIMKTNRSIDDGSLKVCGQTEALHKMQTEDPARYQEYLQARQASAQEDVPSYDRSGTIYTIPIVFHILHSNGTENISQAQVQDALNILNRDFRKQNADVNNVVAQFLPLAGDVEIEFAFATIAPNGACFNGITRTYTTSTSTDGQVQVNAIIAGNDVYQGVWPHNKYLNVYVCESLIDGAAGYTFLPQGSATASATNMYYNGIFMLHDYTGSIGTSSVYTSRALTHEVGHWLNLDHVWGGGAIGTCGTDNVSDTPQTNGSNGVCTLSKTSCDGTLDNVENYMDYSYCSKMFTAGQVTRMRNAVVNATAGRSNTWSAANLQSVGVTGGGSSLCSADFEATPTGLCAGNSTTFAVTNTSVAITSYSWTFTGGTPATSTAAAPTVTYNTPGTYQVAVTINSASGNRTITKTAYITVASSGTSASLPITEGFVSATFPPTNWSITNGGTSNTWVRNGARGTAPTAGNSAVIDFYNTETSQGNIDDLNTPSFTLSGYSSASLTFDVAYRTYTGQSDKLEVLVSPGCGLAYEVVYTKAGTTLQTEAGTTTGYTNPATWRNETVNLTPYVGNGQVSVKFRGTNGYGNFLYIDNVNITGTASGPNANFTPSTSSACVGQTVTYTNSSSGATSWNWNFGTGATPATATGAGPHVVTYSSAGAKQVSLTINSGASTSNQTVNVNAIPSVPSVSVTDNCGSSILNASGSGLQWSTGSTSNSITVTTSNQVTVTQSSQGCVSAAATVNPNPKPLPTVTMGSLPTVCVYHNPITLTQGAPAGGTYSGTGVTGGNQFSPSAAGTGTKTVTYSYTAANGCTNTATAQILVDGCLSLDVESEKMFSVFPNPTSGDVVVRSSSAINEITVMDNSGRIVSVLNGNYSTEVKLDLNHLAAGSYHIHTKMEESSKIVKLIIQ